MQTPIDYSKPLAVVDDLNSYSSIIEQPSLLKFVNYPVGEDEYSKMVYKLAAVVSYTVKYKGDDIPYTYIGMYDPYGYEIASNGTTTPIQYLKNAKQRITRWFNVYNNRVGQTLFKTEQDAKNNIRGSDVTYVTTMSVSWEE